MVLNILKHFDQKNQTRKFIHNLFHNVSIPPHLSGCHAIGINSSLISFLSVLPFLKLEGISATKL